LRRGILHSAIEPAMPASRDGEASPASVPSPLNHALWVFGANTVDELAEVFTKMDLDGVAEQIVCPLLVMHGELDCRFHSYTQKHLRTGRRRRQDTQDLLSTIQKRALKLAEQGKIDKSAGMFLPSSLHTDFLARLSARVE
jgi:pimeloyl-ACP methyl ester carboxylesterase